MSDWITLTDADIVARMNAAEVAALNQIQGAAGNGVAAILADEIASVRGSIKKGGNQRGPDGTTPASLTKHIVASVIWQWLNSFSKNAALQTDGRKALAAAAQAEYDAIETGKKKVELPDAGDPADTVAAPVNAIQQASGERRQLSRRELEGL